MSHIPNAAIPHALPHDEPEEPSRVRDFARTFADKVRSTPKVAIAAGAAVVVGGLVAAALPKAAKAAKPKRATRAKPKA